MAATIPVHYHEFPRTTGVDTVYQEALPVWDVNAKRIVVGDGVTPGGIMMPNFNDDLSYIRKFILANTTASPKDWLICTTALTIQLPENPTALTMVRISTLADVEPVTVKDGNNTILTLGVSTTVELVYQETSWVITENTSAASDLGDYVRKEALMLNGAAAQLVSFKSMTQESYDRLTSPVIDAVYFLTDTKRLMFNGVTYGSGGGGGGEPGVSTYTYVAYAADDTGAGFSMVPTNDLPYRAEIHVHAEIPNPTLSDFAGAVWIKYIATGGGGGTGGAPKQAFTKDDVTEETTGDNQNAAFITVSSTFTVVGILDDEKVQWNLPSQAVKQSDNSTTIDIASVLADKDLTVDNMVGTWYVLFAAAEGGTAGEVAWGDISGKPLTYPPAAHKHAISDVEGLETALDNAGKVKTVNGIEPDENGNIEIASGGVDEKRLLPVPTADDLGKVPVVVSGSDDIHYELQEAPASAGLRPRLVGGDVYAEVNDWMIFREAGSAQLPTSIDLGQVKVTAEVADVQVLPGPGAKVADDDGLKFDMAGYSVLFQYRATDKNWHPIEITSSSPVALKAKEDNPKPVMPTEGLVFYAPLDSIAVPIGPAITNNGVVFAEDATLKRNVAQFNGSANFTFNASGLPTGASACTKSLWIYFDGSTGQVYLMAYGSDSTNRASTIAARNNQWSWAFAGPWDDTNIAAPLNKWTHVATTHQGGVNTLYVNGVLVNTFSRDLDVSGTSGVLGSFITGSEKLTGSMASVRIYNRILETKEIVTLASEFTV